MSEKLLINQVIFKPIPTLENGELSDKIIRKCHFCGKKCEFSENSSHLSQKLSGNDCDNVLINDTESETFHHLFENIDF